MKKRPNTLLSSKRLVAIAAVVLLVGGVILVGEGLIDTKSIHDQLVQIVKEKTGKDIAIRGNVTVSMLPRPGIYVPGIDIRDSNSESPAPALSVEMIRISVNPLSVFSGKPQITGITIQQPLFELSRGHDGSIHWDWLNAGLLKSLQGAGSNISVSIEDGRVLYHNAITDKNIEIDNINVGGALGAQPALNGSLSVAGNNIRMSFGKDNSPGAGTGGLPLIFKLFTNDKNNLQWQGSLDTSGENPVLNGKLTIETEDLLPALHMQAPAKPDAFAKVTNEAVPMPQDTTAFPLKLTASWHEEGTNISLNDVVLQGLNSAATGKTQLSWNGNVPVFDADFGFSALDYNQWQLLAERLLDIEKVNHVTPPGVYGASDEPQENPLPKDIQFNLKLAAEQLYISNQAWQHVQLLTKLAEGTLTVDQFNVELPGNTILSLFGVISEGTTSKGLRFEGSMETKGKSLRQALTVLDESAKELPDTSFGEFFVRANIFASSEQVRLSEAEAQISDLHLNGGLVGYFDTNPRLEADIKLKDINFDYFRDVWRRSHKDNDTGKQDFFLKFDKTQSFDWLKKLQTNIDFRVSVDRFTFLDRRGSTASFRLFAQPNEFGIYDIRMVYPTEMTEASLRLDVSGEQPAVNVLLNTSQLNTDYFNVKPGAEQKPDALKAAAIAKPEDESKEEAEMPVVQTAPKTGDQKKINMVPQAQGAIELAQAMPPQAIPKPADTVEDLPRAKTVSLQSEPGKKQWPQDLIDMSWMEGISGAFDISVGKLTHHDMSFDNVKLRAKLESNSLTIQSLSFNYWQGQCNMTGSLYGGTVPGMAVSFTMYDNELHDILQSLLGWNNITGRVSVSGTLTTSGVNLYSWLAQSEAKLVVAGRGVVVDGINMQGVVNAVQVSRTASDVLNNVNTAVLNGSTEFNIDGNLNVKNGTIRTPGITLKTGLITGNLTGEMELVPWTMALSALFQFPTMTSETVPTMAMQLVGQIEHGQLQTDTSSLEAYVAKRIVGN